MNSINVYYIFHDMEKNHWLIKLSTSYEKDSILLYLLYLNYIHISMF